jgi:hypothetical protein
MLEWNRDLGPSTNLCDTACQVPHGPPYRGRMFSERVFAYWKRLLVGRLWPHYHGPSSKACI